MSTLKHPASVVGREKPLGKVVHLASSWGLKGTVLILLALGLLVGRAKAQDTNRYVNFDADPAAFGINGEQINPQDWEVEYFRLPDDNSKLGFRLHNTVDTNNYVEIRGIFPIQYGGSFVIDGVGMFPYITVDPSKRGGPHILDSLAAELRWIRDC